MQHVHSISGVIRHIGMALISFEMLIIKPFSIQELLHLCSHWLFPSFDFFREVIAEGKQLEYIDEYVGPFLLDWLPGLLTSPQAADALNLIIVLVKFNSAYLDEPVVTGFVK